ncbi:MAG: hypothetical protein JSR96_07330 [Proteobacteria bacterium]|nr:hypothetical protein [Pseudomonadota bacterium]
MMMVMMAVPVPMVVAVSGRMALLAVIVVFAHLFALDQALHKCRSAARFDGMQCPKSRQFAAYQSRTCAKITSLLTLV